MDKAKQAVVDAALNWVEAEDARQKALVALRRAVEALGEGDASLIQSVSAEDAYEAIQQAALLRHTLDELDELRQRLQDVTDQERRKLDDMVAEKTQLVRTLENKRNRIWRT